MAHSARKTIDHPTFGRLTLDCGTLLLPDTDRWLVVCSTAAGTREAAMLETLRATATDDAAGSLLETTHGLAAGTVSDAGSVPRRRE